MEGKSGDGMASMVSICLGILQVGGLALAGAISLFRRRQIRSPRTVGVPQSPVATLLTDHLGFRIRAGPSVLQVFRR